MNSTPSNEPVGYMERTRLYYRALGYEADYVWSTYEDVPFAQLKKPLNQSRIALVTTASAPDLSNLDENGRKQVWSGNVDTAPKELFTDNVAWDKESTHTRDRECFLPIDTANALAADGIIAGLTERFHGVPTLYSQRETIERDAPEIARRVSEDGADAVILTPL